MYFRVYAGNMYCGRLFIGQYMQIFYPRANSAIVQPNTSKPIARIKAYKQLRLVRVA